MAEDTFDVTFLLKDSLGFPHQLDALETVTVVALESETLRALAAKAWEEASLPPPSDLNSIMFLSLPDDQGERSPAPFLDVGVDKEGHLFWRVGVGSEITTLGDVIRASKWGLFKGDPLAYVVDRGGYGDSGLILTWDDLISALKEFQAVGGGVALLAASAAWLSRFFGIHLRRWIPRHARFPSTFLNTIVMRSEWDVTKLAQLLEVEVSEATQLLEALGYGEYPDRVYRWTNEPDKAHLRKRLAERHFLWDGWHDVKSEPRETEDEL